MKNNTLLLIVLLFTLAGKVFGQGEVIINKVVAVVGDQLILQSDIEAEYIQATGNGAEGTPALKCKVLEELMFQKLLVNQAELDSIEITEGQIEQELDQRIRFFVSQIGSEQKLEEYYGKSILQIKSDFKEDVRKMLLARTMKGKITNDIKVTPSEVRAFFSTIPSDSLPLINSEVEVMQIVKSPPISKSEKARIKEKLESLRERINGGEDMATLAILYSEDPGSAKNGGELGFVSRNELVPEFAAEAFNLKGKEVSRIIETQFGFHIIQLIERRGDQVNVRHILMIPQSNANDLYRSQLECDSIRNLITEGKYTFAQAAEKFSDDKETKFNGGAMINMLTGTTRFETDELDPQVYFSIEKLAVGEISQPVKMVGTDSKQAYRIVMLKTRTEPHKANLKEDYQRIQNIALMQKQDKAVDAWIKKKVNSTFIKIDDAYLTCSFERPWIATESKTPVK